MAKDQDKAELGPSPGPAPAPGPPEGGEPAHFARLRDLASRFAQGGRQIDVQALGAAGHDLVVLLQDLMRLRRE